MTTPISQKKLSQVKERLQNLNIKESDLKESFIRGSGKGGQKINKTNSCVVLTHTPSGIVIHCQKTRSRESNRFWARRLLLDKLEHKILGKASDQAKKIHKLKAQKKKRSKRAKQKILNAKKQRSETKMLRQKPAQPD